MKFRKLRTVLVIVAISALALLGILDVVEDNLKVGIAALFLSIANALLLL